MELDIYYGQTIPYPKSEDTLGCTPFCLQIEGHRAITDVCNVKPSKVEHWMQSYEWLETLAYWREGHKKQGDFNIAQRRWTEMIENREDLFPVEYPDVPDDISVSEGTLDVSALIASHLFCADNLCDDEIRARLAEERKFESPPVRYEGEPPLENLYHWWLYPNYSDGIFSKVLARVNVVGDLVVGTGEDTSLVIIRYGGLTLARQVSDDVASPYDERLLVCL